MLAGVSTFAACGACGKGTPSGPKNTSASASTSASVSKLTMTFYGDAGPRNLTMWTNAKDGEEEDLATLATHEGAIGLVAAAEEDKALRPVAMRAMAHARGWAHLPFLANVAAGPDAAEAKAALESIIDLAARPRRSEDQEDFEELREGCEKLLGLAKDVKSARERRVPAVRALRMMPCPKADLPTDLDAK